MAKKPGVSHQLAKDGVHVFVPLQESGVSVTINMKDYVDPPDEPPIFTVVRHLRNSNFQVLDGNNNPVQVFAPPMEITICYTQKDIDEAQNAERPQKRLKLGVWINDKWWILPTLGKPVECPHGDQYHLGAYKAIITGRWADPELAWGT